jgi:hypothetical protein
MVAESRRKESFRLSRLQAVFARRYSELVTNAPHRLDKPEPRWQALLAFLAVGGIYLALPRSLIIGPTWLLPTLMVVLLVPTVVTHRTGKRSLNRALGLLINAVITFALLGSVILLVTASLSLLFSGAELWITNVLVFALWYWRLDGGGPTLRHERKEFGSRSFLFPQMQLEKSERGRFECKDGVRILWTIFSSRSLRAPPLVRPTHRFSCAGQKFSR